MVTLSTGDILIPELTTVSTFESDDTKVVTGETLVVTVDDEENDGEVEREVFSFVLLSLTEDEVTDGKQGAKTEGDGSGKGGSMLHTFGDLQTGDDGGVGNWASNNFLRAPHIL